jgi:2-hydroxychromene-2-carboxylate isomerase
VLVEGLAGARPWWLEDAYVGREEVERLAITQGLPSPRWPDGWPGDGLLAARAAIFAQQAGRVVAFSLAAFRQQFAAGRDLSVPDNVLIAAAACELHPRAVLKGMESRGVQQRLEEAVKEAVAAGVSEVPTLEPRELS